MSEVKFAGKVVTVRQLTVREVNEYLEASVEPPTCAELLMNRELPERVIRKSTGLSSEELNGDVPPSELQALWNAVADANPFLADLLRRLSAAGRDVMATLQAEDNSGAAPAPSPGSTDTAG